MGDVTRILSDIEDGDSGAAEQLLPLIYDELRRLAAQKMAGESPDHTLQATALVHEAYVRLVDVEQSQHWNSRGHFYSAAAEAMRRILINRARDNKRIKRGGGRCTIDLDQVEIAATLPSEHLEVVDEAIKRLGMEDQLVGDLVRLRFFAGLTLGEAAASLGIARRTADRKWAYARAWLYDQLRQDLH
jgi:RNA polymerase sigma factor (TIGR02999 family)